MQPGVLEQLLRLLRVEVVLGDVVRVPEHVRRHELLRHLAAAAVERVHDALPVEAVSDRLPDLELVHGRLRLVDPDVADVEGRPVEDLQAGISREGLDVLWLDEVVALDVPGLERLQARRVVGDRREDQRVELGLVAPVVVVADERQPGAPLPRVELERARADRMLGAERPGWLEDAVGVDRAVVGAELRQRLRARDREAREREGAENGGRRLGQRDDRRALIRGLAALVVAVLRCTALRVELGESTEDGLPVVGRARVLERAAEVVPAVEVGADGLGVERLAVVEDHAVAQFERVRQAVLRELPALSEAGLELGRAGLQRDESLVDLVDRPKRLAVGDERAVEDDRVGGGAEDEIASCLASARVSGSTCVPSALVVVISAAPGQAQREQQRDKQQEEPKRLSPHILSFAQFALPLMQAGKYPAAWTTMLGLWLGEVKVPCTYNSARRVKRRGEPTTGGWINRSRGVDTRRARFCRPAPMRRGHWPAKAGVGTPCGEFPPRRSSEGKAVRAAAGGGRLPGTRSAARARRRPRRAREERRGAGAPGPRAGERARA